MTVGVPLPDDPMSGITDVDQLTLTGTAVGQFRVLGRWPSGRIKWVLVDTQATLAAGQKNTSITLTSGGSGSFGGANLATDSDPGNRSSGGITVRTAAGTSFIIRKARFNGIDQAVVDGVTILAPGTSEGFVITGPAYPQTTCAGGCATEYRSSNDAASTCLIEKNGPAQAVIKCDWDYKDGSSNTYLRGTARMYFYHGKTRVKVTSILRNADYGISGTFASAFKAIRGYELRTGVNLSGTLNYTIANHTGAPATGTMGGADTAYVYQGGSTLMNDNHNCGLPFCTLYTADSGYVIKKNGSVLASGTRAQYPEGWADISNAAGAGLEIGAYQFAAYGPKSLKFSAGGTEAIIGIMALENSTAVQVAWPQHMIDDVMLNFHSTAPASLAGEFLKFQHHLVSRADRTQYNNTGVLPYKLVDPAEEDAYYAAAVSSATPAISTNRACCIQDVGVADASWPLIANKVYDYNEGGAANQMEWRYSYLTNYLTRGMSGRYLQAAHFYKMQAESGAPRSDGFNWRDKAHFNSASADVDGFGRPSTGTIFPLNYNSAMRSWPDQEHNHWWGILYYYLLSGDETIHDAILDAPKDWYLNTDTYQNGKLGYSGFPSGKVNVSGTAVHRASGDNFPAWAVGQPIFINDVIYTVQSVTNGTDLILTSPAGSLAEAQWYLAGGVANSRAVGVQLTSSARFHEFLTSTGDPDAAGVLQQSMNLYTMQVKPDLCASGFPGGCTAGNLAGGPWTTQGVSRARGVHFTASGVGGLDPYCGAAVGGAGWGYRGSAPFQNSILIQGLWDLRAAAGPGWPDYTTALDLAYGLSQWTLTEGYGYDNTISWTNNGPRYYVLFDRPNDACDGTYYPVRPVATTWFAFFVTQAVTGSAEWEPKFRIAMQKGWAGTGIGYGSWQDFGGYQIAAVIDRIKRPGTGKLAGIPVAGFGDNGGGSYTIAWTVPSGAQSYRIKWGPKRIVDWIGFDPATNQFTGDSANTMNWFAGNEAGNVPVPAAGTQSMTIATGMTGLTSANFSVKAYITGGQVPPLGPANLLSVSGDNQTGTVNQPLANPFTVKATDSSGNPLAGIGVTFTVTAGVGTFSATQVATDAQGLASSRLTLGSSAGINTVIASSGTLPPVTFTATAITGGTTPASLVLVSGNNQTGTAGQSLANPFVVKVTDTAGNPVAGVGVTFTVTAGGGTLSATRANTDSQGQASVTLTLGAIAGNNGVLVSAGTLAPLTLTATGVVAPPLSPVSGTQVTWNKQPASSGWPGFAGWLSLLYDPISGQSVLYGVAQKSGSIYSSELFFYNSSSNTFTRLGGTGSSVDTCTLDTPAWPGDRHPYGQMAVDNKRNLIWMYGGANQSCARFSVSVSGATVTNTSASPFVSGGNWDGAAVSVGGVACGTVVGVQDANHLTLSSAACTQGASTMQFTDPGNRHPKQDTYNLTLNADPAKNAWRRVTARHYPEWAMEQSLIYDPDTDVLFAYGYDGGPDTNDSWVYCPTDWNPTPGILTTAQSAAGCSVNGPDDWSPVTTTSPSPGALRGHPPASRMTAMVYDTANKQVILYGGQTSGAEAKNETWTYSVPSRTWAQRAVSAAAPPLDTVSYSNPALVYNTATQKVIYHHVGGPGDWEYDPRTETWSRIDSTGSGATTPQAMAYDSLRNVLVGFNQVPNGISAEVWHGALGASTAQPAARCDLNGDGMVNGADVQAAVDQALGITACGTADLIGDGACDVLDVQRMINASNGGVCKTGL